MESVKSAPARLTWDLRAAICRAGCEQVCELEDETLMFLLLEAVFPGDVDELFSELYARYHARVRGWCNRFVHDSSRADDMAQEVFLRAFRYRHSFRGEARASTWLFTIARNYCLTALKRAKGEPSMGAGPLDPRIKGESGRETQQRIEREELFGRVWSLIETALTTTEARVMVLHYGHGLPLSLISAQLSLTNPSGAKAYIVNARRKISSALTRKGIVTAVRRAPAKPAAIAA
jgi:RNA polymerase sigma-70 factor (ECF subfamily)